MDNIKCECEMVITKNCSPQIVLGVINKINLYIKELLSATITKEEEEMLITIMKMFCHIFELNTPILTDSLIESLDSYPDPVFSKGSDYLPMFTTSLLHSIQMTESQYCNKIIQLITRFLRCSPNNQSLLSAFLSSCNDLIDKVPIPYDCFTISFWVIFQWDSSILDLNSDELKKIITIFQSLSSNKDEWKYLILACNEKTMNIKNISFVSSSPIRSRIASSQSSFLSDSPQKVLPPKHSIPSKQEKPSLFPVVILLCIILLSFGGLLYIVFTNPLEQVTGPTREFANYDSPVFYNRRDVEECVGKECENEVKNGYEYEVNNENEYEVKKNEYEYEVNNEYDDSLVKTEYNQQQSLDSSSYQEFIDNSLQKKHTSDAYIHEEENAFIIEEEPQPPAKQTTTTTQEFVDIRLASDQTSPFFLVLFFLIFIACIVFFWRFYSSTTQQASQSFSTPIKNRRSSLPDGITPVPDSIRLPSHGNALFSSVKYN